MWFFSILSIRKETFNNIIFNLNVAISGVLKYLLNLPTQTNTILIYEKLNVNTFKIIYYKAVLVDLYKNKHLIPVSDHEHNTRYISDMLIYAY